MSENKDLPVMELLSSRESDDEVDLESGASTSEEDASKDPAASGNRETNIVLSGFLGWLWNLNGSDDAEPSVSFNCGGSNRLATEKVEVLLEQNLQCQESQEQEEEPFPEKKCPPKDTGKKNSMRAPKPPRPPKGPVLDAADQKLVREMAEFALRKRERIERIRALKKMKASRGSSSSGSLSAMIISLLFCFVIIFQVLRNNGGIS